MMINLRFRLDMYYAIKYEVKIKHFNLNKLYTVMFKNIIGKIIRKEAAVFVF